MIRHKHQNSDTDSSQEVVWEVADSKFTWLWLKNQTDMRMRSYVKNYLHDIHVYTT